MKAPNGAPCSVTARALRDLSGCASGKCYNKLCSDGAIGSSCDNHDNCVSKFCKANVCSEKAPKGAPCVDRFGCITNDCAMNICSDGTDGSTCRWGSHCKSRSCMNNICTPKAAVGGVCVFSLDCISGKCFNGKCSDGALGSSCESNANCVSKSCVNNVCVVKIAIPLCGPCTKKSECISGFCDWTLNICTYGLKVQPECQK